MSGDAMDEKLHDYLDGRLTEEERREFEARLERDPELAGRVESYRELGRTMREDPLEPPPGFYTRARARFEASRRPRTGWSRVLSWEATGLAAAAVLLVAILLPVVMEQRPDLDALAPKSTPRSTEAPAELDEVEETPAAEPSPGAGFATGALPEVEEQRPAAQAKDRPAPAASVGDDRLRQVEPGRKEAEKKKARPPAPAAPEPIREPDAPAGAESETSAEGALRDTFRSDDAEPSRAPVDENLSERRQEVDDKADADRFAPEPQAVERRMRARPESSSLLKAESDAEERRLAGAEIARGNLEPGEVRIIDDAATWERERHALTADGLDRLGPDFSRERVVLIGPRVPSLDCGSASLLEIGDRLVVMLSPASGESPGVGCAVSIPAGDREVEIVVRSGDDRE